MYHLFILSVKYTYVQFISSSQNQYTMQIKILTKRTKLSCHWQSPWHCTSLENSPNLILSYTTVDSYSLRNSHPSTWQRWLDIASQALAVVNSMWQSYSYDNICGVWFMQHTALKWFAIAEMTLKVLGQGHHYRCYQIAICDFLSEVCSNHVCLAVYLEYMICWRDRLNCDNTYHTCILSCALCTKWKSLPKITTYMVIMFI